MMECNVSKGAAGQVCLKIDCLFLWGLGSRHRAWHDGVRQLGYHRGDCVQAVLVPRSEKPHRGHSVRGEAGGLGEGTVHVQVKPAFTSFLPLVCGM